MMPLSRRALYEKKPVVINTVIESDRIATDTDADWELDWPAVLYVPVGALGQRPIGLLIVGCRRDHWYSEDDIAYAQTLGFSLVSLVAALRGRLGRLSEVETEVAHLLSYGLSAQEIAQALQTDAHHARQLVDAVTRKFRSLSAEDLRFPPIQLRRMTW